MHSTPLHLPGIWSGRIHPAWAGLARGVTALLIASVATTLMNAAGADGAGVEAAATPNRLIHEKSAYLRQHANNPVDWYPWGPEAFAKAKAENKPIFLSIGYATCHWCHVMARESFADPATAAVLNEHYVAIKVDREERPDVDRVYLTFVQATTGGGGWPMSVWLTPELKPFFGGTYFPPRGTAGRPGFKDLLGRIAGRWERDREEILQQSDRMLQALAQDTGTSAAAAPLPVADLRAKAWREAVDTFDAKHGGFGGAPKFPHPPMLEFLFAVAATASDADQRASAQDLAVKTLRAMAAGGIRDHLGGGFHRYTVDAAWRVPHFEKMLYDQAQLAVAYLTAGQLASDPELSDVARDILAYVRRELTDPAGGFHSAVDADSARASNPEEHGEGAFYVWTADEIGAVLEPEAAAVFRFLFGVKPDGNVAGTDDPQGEFRRQNIIYRARTIAEAAAEFTMSEAEVRALLAAARAKLLVARGSRPPPLRDRKVVTAWNGLMISAFARAAALLGDASYAETATRAAEFLHTQHYDARTGRLLRSFRDGSRDDAGFAEDYAFVIQGLLDLYEATFDTSWLAWAVQLQEKQTELFWDETGGGFFATTGEDQSVLLRLKEDYDGAEPSPNSVAVRNLARLAGFLHRDSWREQATRTAQAFGATLDRAPQSMPQLLANLGWIDRPPAQIIIVGEPGARRTAELLAEVARVPLPHRVVLRIDQRSRAFFEREVELIRDLPTETGDAATAYLCENFTCQQPTNDPAIFARQLRAATARHP